MVYNIENKKNNSFSRNLKKVKKAKKNFVKLKVIKNLNDHRKNLILFA